MKVFWALILVLAIAGAGMLWLRGSGGGNAGGGSPQASATAHEAAPAASPRLAEVPKVPGPEAGSSSAAAASSREKVEASVAKPSEPETPAAPLPPVAPLASKSDDPMQSVTPAPAPSTTPEAPVATQAPQTPVVAPPVASPPVATPAAPSQSTATIPGSSVPAPPAGPAPTGEHTGVAPPPTEYKPSDQPAKPHSAVVQGDGSTLIDERFKVTGDGSKERPYVIPWDLLVSASEEYSPRDGRTELPQRIKMFDGKYVELTGHVAFPLLVEEPRELLSMLNQWDGCCIGVPPTPYDAVEVKLTKTVKGPDRLASYGIVRGKMRVEPQLVGKWLVALYAMSDAELVPKGYGGFTP